MVRISFLEAVTFELRLAGANLEKVLEKGVLGREKGRVSKFKRTNLEKERRQVGGVETSSWGRQRLDPVVCLLALVRSFNFIRNAVGEVRRFKVSSHPVFVFVRDLCSCCGQDPSKSSLAPDPVLSAQGPGPQRKTPHGV